ncbi:hypothetical protein L1987_50395 [Smallanthus sonchifolius]|uniref:Uncharacterized protein n=1 Tax=Smallanthus sonchifolius TaxID=185202 RepID=A0ACB9EMD6_9ASTR|nr:hypothetical protein L1987_50395 [Smallanthus sonchifolius]
MGLLIVCLLIPFWVASFKDEKEVNLVTNKTHQEVRSIIQSAMTTLLMMNSSATNLAKLVYASLGKTDNVFSHIQAKVAPLLLEALLTIPRVSQISYIRKDGLFFALYSQPDHQIFAVYSNSSFSKATSAPISHRWYTQRVDSDTGHLYGEVVVFPTLIDEKWLQQALNTTNGSAQLGNSWNDDKNPLVSNIARVDKTGVISLRFELKSLLNVFSGIKPFGGGLYIATKDGKVASDGIPNTRIVLEANATVTFQILKANGDRITLQLNPETPKAYVFDMSGTKYVLYPSSLDIIGTQTVYVLALPYDKVKSKTYQNLVMVSLFSSLIIVTIAISVALAMKSARKEMNLRDALIKQKETTQQLERKSKNQSVSFETASHDIRASLAAISGSIEISINENHQGSELATDLRIVESSTKYLQGLLNSILDTSKIEAGKMELEEKPFDLVKSLEGVVDLFYPVGLKKEVDVILDLQDDLLTKFSQVKGDERRLKQILSNLLSNAIKFTSEGHVSVRVRARSMSPKPHSSTVASDLDRFQRWRSCFYFGNKEKCGDLEAVNEVDNDHNCMEFVFEVNDTGKGIAKEKQASIFENYVQVKETEHEFEGTGLGLAIVQSLVRLMGGEISIVDKEPGEKGTCFMFNVVFKVVRSDLYVVSEDEKIIMSSGSNTPFCSPKRKDYNHTAVVLFISSDERRKVLQKFLRAHGLKVFAARTVGELAETLKEFRRAVGKVCSSSGSYLNLSFGYLTRPGRSPKEVPLSALDGTDVSPARMNNRAALPGFVLLVIDTTRADFRELCKVVAEFRKDSKDDCFRVVWLGFRCMQVHGLDEKQLPPSDVVVPMPLHGSRLYSLIDFLPEFREKFLGKPPQGNQLTPGRQVEIQDISRISPSGRSPLRGKKVLLVEDNSTQQMIAKRIFVKNGVIFDTCTDGKEALTFISKGLTDQKYLGASHILPYDYILMDCQMPVMDGCEATRQIRLMEKDYGVHIPIIGLTAHSEGEKLNKFVKEIDIHVSKPLNEHKLLKVIGDLHSRN